MTDTDSALYAGTVLHRRLRPKAHMLSYKVFSLLIDLDHLPETARACPLLAINRRGLLSFHERDHGDNRTTGLRHWVCEQLSASGVDTKGIRVRMLCYPRILGYVFNPLTVYFCSRNDGSMAAMLYQVQNTFGEQHTYVIPVASGECAPYRQACDKAMYVSPFTPMQSRYRFSIVAPADNIAVVIQQEDSDGPFLNASFTGNRQPLTTRTLLRAVIAHPLMSLKVIVGIHIEAFRLWRKGVPVFRHIRQTQGKVSLVQVPDHERRAAS